MSEAPERIVPSCVEALENYQQADMDGIIVLASRQAIHETIDAYWARVETCENLEAENRLLTTYGIDEVAVRNPEVMEYMQHWEGRALDAEAKLAMADKLASEFKNCLEVLTKEDGYVCCSGHQCGCYGASLHAQAIYYANEAIDDYHKTTGGKDE